jgi:hypothetical protein
MSDKTDGNRGVRRAGALAVVAGVAGLTTACGVVHVHFGSSASSASTGSPAYAQVLAFAQCMRGHGVPNFPDPGQSRQQGASVNPNSPHYLAAANACQHLLPPGTHVSISTSWSNSLS